MPLLKSIKISKPCIVLWFNNDVVNLYMDGNHNDLAFIISDSIIKSEKFRNVIINAIKTYQEQMN